MSDDGITDLCITLRKYARAWASSQVMITFSHQRHRCPELSRLILRNNAISPVGAEALARLLAWQGGGKSGEAQHDANVVAAGGTRNRRDWLAREKRQEGKAGHGQANDGHQNGLLRRASSHVLVPEHLKRRSSLANNLPPVCVASTLRGMLILRCLED